MKTANTMKMTMLVATLLFSGAAVAADGKSAKADAKTVANTAAPCAQPSLLTRATTAATTAACFPKQFVYDNSTGKFNMVVRAAVAAAVVYAACKAVSFVADQVDARS